MVWVLESESITDIRRNGPSKYMFTKTGVFKVGRKDCTIVINTDKAVSRLHAELIVEEQRNNSVSKETAQDVIIPRLRVRDKSKLGTFIKRNEGGPIVAVLSLSGKEAALSDGDTIMFGTNKTSFRVYFQRFVVSFPISKQRVAGVQSRLDIIEEFTRIGVQVFNSWQADCTHVVVEEETSDTSLLMAAFLFAKIIVTPQWLQAVLQRESLEDPLPTVDSFPIRISIGRSTQETALLTRATSWKVLLKGHTFIVAEKHLYADYFIELLEASGGSVEPISKLVENVSEEYLSQRIFVVPRDEAEWGMTDVSETLTKLRRIMESRIACSVLSGNTEWLSLVEPPQTVLNVDTVSSSTTEETSSEAEKVEAEVDSVSGKDGRFGDATNNREETEAASLKLAKVNQTNSATEPIKPGWEALSKRKLSPESGIPLADTTELGKTIGKLDKWERRFKRPKQTGSDWVPGNRRASGMWTGVTQREGFDRTKMEEERDDKPDGKLVVEVEVESMADVVFSPLLVAKQPLKTSKSGSEAAGAPNFKRFRKVTGGQSGNSFRALVPFSREPYRESDLAKELQAFMQRERKRKETEAAAEDLFNADKLKRIKVNPSAVNLHAPKPLFHKVK